MRVDHDLLREVLEHLEQAPCPEVLRLPEFPGIAPEVQAWHAQLLIDGGFVTAQQLRPYRTATAIGLTFAGQKLLDELRPGPSGLRSVGEVASNIVTSVAVGLLTAKVKALTLGLG